MSPLRLLFILCAILVGAVPAAANKPGKDTTFIFVRDADTTIMSGNLSDLKHVKKELRKGERLLWFRTADGKELVVRDPATLDQFETAWKAAEALGQKQGDIGNKQGLIGARQGAVGAKQGVIGARQGVLGNKQAALEERAASARSASEREAVAQKRRALEAEMRELEQKMNVLEDQMRELEKPMRALQQQMDIISKQHEAATKQAQADSEAIIARAITTGLAKPL